MAAGERSIRIRFDGSARGLTTAAAKARAQLKAMQKQVEDNKKNLVAFSSSVGRVAKRLAKFALVIASVSGLVGLIGAITAAVAALSGAVGLLPAAALAAAGAMAAVKLGADGIKKAFKGLDPTLKQLKSDVSAAFEQTLGPAVDHLQTVLPKLSSGLSGIARQMGKAAAAFTAMLATAPATSQLQSILSATATAVHNIGVALAPVGAAFLRIGSVAIPTLTRMTSGVGSLAQRFNAFVQHAANSGQLQAWINSGITAVKQLGSVLGDLGAIVLDVLGALQRAGVGVGGTLGKVVHQVRAFLESAQGQDVLTSLASAVAAVGNAVHKVLGAALKAIGPALPDILDAFRQLVTTLTPTFVAVITQVGTALQGVAGFLADNMHWLTPVVAAVGALALAIRAVTKAVRLWKIAVAAYTVVQWALNVAMDANPIGAIIAAVLVLIGLVALIIKNWKPISGFFKGLWKGVKDAFGAAIDWVKTRFSDVWHFITGLWRGITGFFSGLWHGVVSGVRSAVGLVRRAWSSAVEGIKGFFRGLGRVASNIWGGIVSAAKSVINGAISVINGIIHGINRVTGVVGIPAIPDIPHLARGGTAKAGRTYLVGENGPELFTPGVTGRVTSNEQLSGAPVSVRVFIGDRELRDLVRVEIDEDHRDVRQRVLAGAGALR